MCNTASLSWLRGHGLTVKENTLWDPGIVCLKISPEKMYVLIGLKLCFYNLIATQLAQAVDIMMA